MTELADLHVLCAQIHRFRCLLAIDAELCTRYPELAPMLTAMRGAAETIRGDVGVRRELAGPQIFARTADYAVIPARIRLRWRAGADHQLTAAYLRYQCAGIADTYTGPITATELHAGRPRVRRFVVEWGRTACAEPAAGPPPPDDAPEPDL
ncbi:hypothetical protein ACFV4K_34115 [Nocardia sp. NPDC059764]|uniref:hypothetical protein n=1 Tax=Nocardia sp. NPDC059764 TaxID=3346939 RepID=UPI00364B0601